MHPPAAAAAARLSFWGLGEVSVCAVLDGLRGARIKGVIVQRTLPPELHRLSGLTQLRELRCSAYNLGRRPQLAHVQPLAQLEVLEVMGMATAHANAVLAALPQLRDLSVMDSDLPAVPASAAGLSQLTRLSLFGTPAACLPWRAWPACGC